MSDLKPEVSAQSNTTPATKTVDRGQELVKGLLFLGIAIGVMYWNGGILPNEFPPGRSFENPDPLQWFGSISVLYCWFKGFFPLLRAAGIPV